MELLRKKRVPVSRRRYRTSVWKVAVFENGVTVRATSTKQAYHLAKIGFVYLLDENGRLQQANWRGSETELGEIIAWFKSLSSAEKYLNRLLDEPAIGETNIEGPRQLRLLETDYISPQQNGY